MKDPLEAAKEVLRSFLVDIEKLKELRQGISAPMQAISCSVQNRMPEFHPTEFIPAPDSFWMKDNAYAWLYADTGPFLLSKYKPKQLPTPEYYQQPARPVYQQWRQEEKVVFYRQCEKIPEPIDDISLAGYLEQLAFNISEEAEYRDVWEESLRCFLQFLREDMELGQKGPLELLFPSQESCKGMEIRKDYHFEPKEGKDKKVERCSILRRIETTVYPIDILTASEIIQNLAKTVLEGRPNSQRSAAEALGFAWLCHAVGSYRLLTREDLVFSTEVNKLKCIELREPDQWLNPTHFIGVHSLFGVIDVPISRVLYEFLQALPRDQNDHRIFTMDWTTVLRTFRNKGVKQSKQAKGLGAITFLTFMSPPHHNINYRSILSQKSLKPKKLSPTEQSK